jgi:hypothetical protein
MIMVLTARSGGCGGWALRSVASEAPHELFGPCRANCLDMVLWECLPGFE